MATLFQNILRNAEQKGITDRKSKESIDWFRKNVRKTTKNVNPGRLMKEQGDNMVNSWTNTGPGQMYFVHYDPKHKVTLPYYDTFPLIIPIERYKNGILGLNLHYLPPVLRAKLLDALYDTVTSTRISNRDKFEISYSIVKAAAKSNLMLPCVKRYLGNHFRSRFIRVEPELWSPAVFLPVERFEKASKSKVWSDSRKASR